MSRRRGQGQSKTDRETVHVARVSTCVKVAYHSRMDAKRCERGHPAVTRSGLRPYRCPSCGLWHLGHLPRAVQEGEMTSGEYFGVA